MGDQQYRNTKLFPMSTQWSATTLSSVQIDPPGTVGSHRVAASITSGSCARGTRRINHDLRRPTYTVRIRPGFTVDMHCSTLRLAITR